MSAYGKTDSIPMISFRQSNGAEPRKPWKAEGVAYALAILAHFGLWQLYKAMPVPPPPKEEPLVIEVALAAPKSAPSPAAAPAPPQPQMQPPKPPPPKPQVQPPKPKPVPKVEKPVPKKAEEPKPRPKPVAKPRPEPVREPEAETPPALPVAREEAPPAPPAPVHRVAPPKPAASDDEENNRYTTGTVGGYRMNYPSLAKQRGWEGTVTIKIHVSAGGEIESASVAGSSGHEMLDDSALEMVRSASHVKPCHRGDKPVACSFTQSIHFKLSRE